MLSCLPALCQAQLSLLDDMVLDADAVLMPASAIYGRSLNGVANQSDPLLSYGGYQYAIWYHNGGNEDVYLARRTVGGSSWQTMDTGVNLDNGDAPAWDAHNVISMGISDDGRIHFSWDHHDNTLRYINSQVGAATGATWDASILNPEQNSLTGGAAIGVVTYPRFATDPSSGAMVMTYRTGGSGNGDIQFSSYDSVSGQWDTPHEIIDGQAGFYSDATGSSGDRNAYLNDVSVDATGRIHTTWTWREGAGGTNHDIMYAYSDDDGSTWRNGAGGQVASVGSPINLNSPGITFQTMDRRNSLMNQQTQTVDNDGRVHAVMWHATDANANSLGGSEFNPGASAYFHYFRDPTSGVWDRVQLPNEEGVGSRPFVAHDADDNLYAAYVSPGEGSIGGIYTNGKLVIATASKSTGYQDWEVVHTDSRDFAGEPALDRKRLAQQGVLSVFVQENDAANAAVTGTPLHVLDFNKLANKLVWAGTTGDWVAGPGMDANWDHNGDNVGDGGFANGQRVQFDDDAQDFSVNISTPVTPAGAQFHNAVTGYTFTGAGIGGSGGLHLRGGGTVTLDNAANTYIGPTNIQSGTLLLKGDATVADSASVEVHPGATLDAGGLSSTFTLASGQTLTAHGGSTVAGDVVADGGAVLVSGGAFSQHVTARAGALVRVGVGDLSSLVSAAGLVDNFDSYDNSGGVELGATPGNLTGDTWGGVFNGTGAAAIVDKSGADQAARIHGANNGWRGMTTSLADNFDRDFSIADGETATYFFQFNPTTAVTGSGSGFDTMMGLTDNVGTVDSNNAWQDFAVMPFFVGGADGSADLRIAKTGGPDIEVISNAALDTWHNVWLVIDNDNKLVDVYASTGTDPGVLRANDATYRNGLGVGALNALGFMQGTNNGNAVLFDNIHLARGVDTSHPLATQWADYVVQSGGELMTVHGDFTVEAGAVVSLDAVAPDAHDQLLVGGTLHAGGTLKVLFDSNAPTPELGDTYDLLDFAAASGAFDAFALPQLAADLRWDVSDLLVSGALAIAEALPGDFNGDERVDALDYAVWRENYGVAEDAAVLSGNGTRDTIVDTEDLQLWLANYGALLQTGGGGGGGGGFAPVPEPTSLSLLMLLGVVVCRRQQRLAPYAAQ